MKKCAFTGHRPERLPWGSNENDPRCLALKDAIALFARQALDKGCDYFLCGMARGCDMYFAEAVIKLKEEYPHITLEAAVPFDGQSDYWNSKDKDRWECCLKNFDRVVLVSDQYDDRCYWRRNKYMIDSCQILISVYDGEGGGTGQTVRYAREKGVTIISVWR